MEVVTKYTLMHASYRLFVKVGSVGSLCTTLSTWVNVSEREIQGTRRPPVDCVNLAKKPRGSAILRVLRRLLPPDAACPRAADAVCRWCVDAAH